MAGAAPTKPKQMGKGTAPTWELTSTAGCLRAGRCSRESSSIRNPPIQLQAQASTVSKAQGKQYTSAPDQQSDRGISLLS